MSGPLEGLRVLDLTQYVAGPYCMRLLATYGATVIKVERPCTGDPMRQVGPFVAAPTPHPVGSPFPGSNTRPQVDPTFPGSNTPPQVGSTFSRLNSLRPSRRRGREANADMSLAFLDLNAGKLGVTLNLTHPTGREMLRNLVRRSNVVALLLADLGAEVIRVESTQYFPVMTRGPMARPSAEQIKKVPPISGGYPNREPGERPWNRFPWFNATARNKLGMTVDLKQPKGQQIMKRLARVSDVLISNQTPGVLNDLGIGYETLAKENEKLVYVEASFFGASGPYKSYRALGLQMEAFAGHDLVRHYPDRDVSSNTWAVTADAAGALAIALAAQMALFARTKTGGGQRVDLSMVENFVGLIGHAVLDYTFNNRVQHSLGNRDYFAIQGCYPCAGDDRWLVLTIDDDDAWARFKTALGNPSWAEDARFQTAEGRYADHDVIDTHISAWTRSRQREGAVQCLRANGIPAGPVMDDADAYADPHLQARGFFQEITHADAGTHRYPGPPYQFQRAALTVRKPPVRLGEHNAYIYRQLLGYSAEEFAALEAEGHIGTEYAPQIE